MEGHTRVSTDIFTQTSHQLNLASADEQEIISIFCWKLDRMSALHKHSAVSHALFIVRRNVNSQPALSPASSCQDSNHSTEQDKPHHLYQVLEDAAKKTPLASCPQLVLFLHSIQTCRSFTTKAFIPLPMSQFTWVSSKPVLTSIPHTTCLKQAQRLHPQTNIPISHVASKAWGCTDWAVHPALSQVQHQGWSQALLVSGSTERAEHLAAIDPTVSVSNQSTSHKTRKKKTTQGKSSTFYTTTLNWYSHPKISMPKIPRTVAFYEVFQYSYRK